MIRTLNYDKLRHCILPLLIGLLAFFAGEGIFKVMAERTLGSILRHNMATLATLAILLAFYNENFIPAIFDQRLPLDGVLFTSPFGQRPVDC